MVVVVALFKLSHSYLVKCLQSAHYYVSTLSWLFKKGVFHHSIFIVAT
jgi:hypothetical protein